jgi:thiol-disulfide isomerase/thioredoxin
MKKIILLLLVTVILFSFTKVGKGEYLITGTAKGIKDGKTVTLETQDNKGALLTKETVKIKDGKFEMKGKITEPSFYAIQLEAEAGAPPYDKIPFILESAEISIEIDKDSIHNSKASGSYNNDEYFTFNKELTKIQKPLMDFQKKNMQVMQTAQQAKDTVTINKLMKEYKVLETKIGVVSKAKYLAYAESHPKSFISALIVQGMAGDPTADVSKIEKLYKSLDETLKNTVPGKAVKAKIAELKNPVAPSVTGGKKTKNQTTSKSRTDFTAPNPEGKKVSLKECLGKVTVVDFWASWCGPCRQENPNMVAIYDELHSKGLNFIGVSLDKDAQKWKEAIAKDKLVWNQVSNLKFWEEPIAKQYGVESIPATFILDAKGTIVAQGLRGEELKAKIIMLLAK